jgi:hypothetical protein
VRCVMKKRSTRSRKVESIQSRRPPDLREVGQALGRIVGDGRRAGEVIGRIRAIIAKAPPRRDWVGYEQYDR